jgi:hypothetical protein
MKATFMQPGIKTVVAFTVLAAACNRATQTQPSAVDRPPAGPPYSITGTVTAYRGGPLAGISVGVYPCNEFWFNQCSTVSDAQGHYVIANPGTVSATGLSAGGRGFQTVWKSRVTAQDPTADFVLHPEIDLKAAGDTISDVISGDEFASGDDLLFGGFCNRAPCKTMEFAEFSGDPREVEVRLRWNDPTRRLALYKYSGDPDSLPSPQKPPQRFTGLSEVAATIRVSGYFDALAVAFEDGGGAPPRADDSQSFELTVRPAP